MKLLNHKRRLDSSDILPLFAVGTLFLQVINLFLNSGSTVGVWTLAHKPAPAMVQLLDGHSVAMEPIDHNARSPELIRQFVKSSMGLMFKWSTALPANEETGSNSTLRDPGVAIGGKRITTASWQASAVFSEDFRTPFLEEIAKLTPQGVFGGSTQGLLNITSISDPQPIAAGKWKIDLVAHLMIYDSAHPAGRSIPFNKSIFIRAIEPAIDPLPENSTPIQKAIYQMRQDGLEIIEIQDLDIQQLNG
ncbi:MAG: hypothetical protein NW224_30185 [Leptolyngbyaceae cyanobacterium bins.302]|nr:hypothetical protein [Leptolyngbyaceae cyanobacterium bins.302]